MLLTIDDIELGLKSSLGLASPVASSSIFILSSTLYAFKVPIFVPRKGSLSRCVPASISKLGFNITGLL